MCVRYANKSILYRISTAQNKTIVGSIPTFPAKYYAPLVKWMITQCYERWGGGSIPSWGASFIGDKL